MTEIFVTNEELLSSLIFNLELLLNPYAHPDSFDLEQYDKSLRFGVEYLIKHYKKEMENLND